MDPFAQHSSPDYGRFIHASKYSRFIPDAGRRELWPETVDRYLGFMGDHLFEKFPQAHDKFIETAPWLRETILRLYAMSSMRALASAGPALARDNTAGYNCAYSPLESIEDFDEALYILLCGTGYGYSVESRYVNKLPPVPRRFLYSASPIVVEDSKWGWASALREFMTSMWEGSMRPVDYSKIRPAGSPLRTFGGKASGPEPFRAAIEFCNEKFIKARGRQFCPIEVHDMLCKIANAVISGGVRRSALISLSDVDDEEMAKCKEGAWWEDNPQRGLANNSYVIEGGIHEDTFRREWDYMVEGMAGERGIFSRDAARVKAKALGRDEDVEYGCNPCSEIILRPKQFCNLSEVVARPEDTREDLCEKAKAASILGTLQSTLTYFPYLRSEWKANTEEERLLGTSLTGIMDHPVLSGSLGPEVLEGYLTSMRAEVHRTNREWADYLGIPPSAAATTVKPSGTVSQLVDSASGIHPRYATHYIRTAVESKTNPVSQFLVDKGFPYEQHKFGPGNWVFKFPMAAPATITTADEFMGVSQLKLWDTYNTIWCDHKPSMTCYYRDAEEAQEVGQWVWENIDRISGIAFLQYDGHTYEQAPFIPITAEQYDALQAQMPTGVDWSDLKYYDAGTDHTEAAQTFACKGNTCELA